MLIASKNDNPIFIQGGLAKFGQGGGAPPPYHGMGAVRLLG